MKTASAYVLIRKSYRIKIKLKFMLNSILIGKLIYSLLFNNQNIQRTCKGRIFPLIANSDVPYPYIVYKKSDVSSVICKDGLAQDNVSFSVTVVD